MKKYVVFKIKHEIEEVGSTVDFCKEQAIESFKESIRYGELDDMIEIESVEDVNDDFEIEW